MSAAGSSRCTSSIVRVSPSTVTIRETRMPDTVTSAAESSPLIAAAAIVFIGCTHIGRSRVRPVSTLNAPAQKSAGTAAILPALCIARKSGRNQPRSPSEPLISPSVTRAANAHSSSAGVRRVGCSALKGIINGLNARSSSAVRAQHAWTAVWQSQSE